jgi:hypothetical protein
VTIEVRAKCNDCQAHIPADDEAHIFCEACWHSAQTEITDLKTQLAEACSERDEAEERLALESTVFAEEAREHQRIVKRLLEELHP